MLRVGDYMTPQPHTIGHDQPLVAARRAMREHRIRHLPVLDGGRLVGVLSERDLLLVESLRGEDLDALTIADAMTPAPYVVAPDAPLREATAAMAGHRYGAAIVAERGRVIGIFTTTDVLLLLARLLRRDEGGY
jgi:acetoin utilization protein AcuB